MTQMRDDLRRSFSSGSSRHRVTESSQGALTRSSKLTKTVGFRAWFCF